MQGFFSNVTGVQSCVACPAGRSAADTGSSSCAACGVGSYAATIGSPNCIPCAPVCPVARAVHIGVRRYRSCRARTLTFRKPWCAGDARRVAPPPKQAHPTAHSALLARTLAPMAAPRALHALRWGSFFARPCPISDLASPFRLGIRHLQRSVNCLHSVHGRLARPAPVGLCLHHVSRGLLCEQQRKRRLRRLPPGKTACACICSCPAGSRARHRSGHG